MLFFGERGGVQKSLMPAEPQPDFFCSLSGAWRQTAHWHVQGCAGKAVSPRRRFVTQKTQNKYVIVTHDSMFINKAT